MGTEEQGQKIRDLVDIMRDHNERKEAELRNLAANPTFEKFATAVMDEFYEDLNYLANFDYVVDRTGNRHDIQDLWSTLQDHLRASYRRITGKEYRCSLARAADSIASDANRTSRRNF